MNPREWAEIELFGNTLLMLVLGSAVFVAVAAVLMLARRLLRKRLARLAARDALPALLSAELVVRQTKGWFLLLIAVYVGSRFWLLPAAVDSVLTKIAIITVALQAGIWAATALTATLNARRKRELEEHPDAVAAMDVLSFIARVVIWGAVLLVILDNLNVNITALVAGLGVGGIAIALAAQHILGDLFASLSIVLDKPFVVGDFLIVGDLMGNVEKVGIKTTRVRSLSGEQLIFSNSDLLNSRIRNYGRMFERRIVFSLGVTYQTPAKKLRQIPDLIRAAVEVEEGVRFDRAHFMSHGDFALVFETVYHVLSSDYNEYMDVQQAINLRIHESFEAEGIDFAYPTQTLYVNQFT